MKKNYIFRQSSRQAGFTLIELLVVIAIIGLLSTLAVVALNNARLKSRDARRVADIKQIQTALELFYNDDGDYAPSLAATVCTTNGTGVVDEISGCCLADTGYIDVCTGVVFMNLVPYDPDQSTSYEYVYAADTYHLVYTLEGVTGGIPAGTHCATPAGIQQDGGTDCP